MACSKNVVRASCAEIFRPWTRDCSDAYRSMFRLSVIGCSKLYLSIMLVDFALGLRKKKKMDKETIKNITTKYLQSITMTTCFTTSCLFYSCLLRRLLGRIKYTTIAFLPGLFAGLCYIILTPKNRVQILATTSNAAFESVILRASHSGILSLNVYIETVFFMITNACLMYLAKTSKSKNYNYTWFFRPDKFQQSDDKQLLLKTIYKKIINYFGLGLGFGILRMLIKDVTFFEPRNIHKMFDMNTLKSGIFTGLYVAVYEFTIYFLNRYFQKDQCIHALPAGFLAGLSYAISPSLTINLSAFINLIQLIFNRIDVPSLRRIPMDTIIFCLSMGVILHIQMFHPKSVSKMGSNFINMASGKRMKLMVDAFQKLNRNVL